MNLLRYCAGFVAALPFAASKCVEFVSVDIAVERSANYSRYIQSDTTYSIMMSSGKCIGDVFDGDRTVSLLPTENVEMRAVAVHRLQKDAIAETTMEPMTDEEGFFNVVEVETVYYGVPIRQRLMVGKAGTYVDFQDEYVDFDICAQSFEGYDNRTERRVSDGTLVNRYFGNGSKEIGAIKCGQKILMLPDNDIFIRYLEHVDNRWDVYTAPYVGRIFKTSFIPVVWDDCMYRREDPGSMFLDLSAEYKQRYKNIIAACGSDCLFIDGCSDPEMRIVDLLDANGVIYMGNRAKCIQMKLQTINDETYLTVYAQLLNGMFESALFVSKDARTYSKHKPEVINFDLKDETIDERITVSVDRGVTVYTIPSPNNLKYTIGAVSYNKKYLVGKAFVDDAANVPYTVMSRRITVLNNITTIETETDRDLPTSVSYATSSDGVWLHRPKPMQFELTQLNSNDPNFRVTRLEKDKFLITTTSPHVKIGTVKYKNTVVRPNLRYVLSSKLVYGFSELYVTSQMNETLKFHSRYLLRRGFLDDDETKLFVEQHKEPVELSLQDVFSENLPDHFCVEKHARSVKVYLCKDLFRKTLGAVTFAGQLIVPNNRFYKMREVFVATDFFLSYVIVRSYTDDGECVVEAFGNEVAHGKLNFIRMKNDPVSMDLSPRTKLAEQLYRVSEGNHFIFRVKPEFAASHRLGEVTYHGKVIIPDNDLNFNRTIEVTIETSNDRPTNFLIRVAEIGIYGKSSKLISVNLETRLTKDVPKKSLEVDLSIKGARDSAIAVAQYRETMSFYVPWTRACEYKLDSIVFTNKNNEVDVLIKDLRLNDMPEIRLHGVTPGSEAVLAFTPSGDETRYADLRIDEEGVTTVLEADVCKYDELFMAYYGDL
ncbi:uncharacterized protein BcabD6B2_10700 [Babesia caballi]|uniref:Membrane protein, putative n=1 Tax=Babesia caballi TaxID=5871 RepID=A0AAV4LQ59_BABCB|nr:membrane protein, putative [Babesia caballi]